MSARKDLLKIVAKVRKDADDYIVIGVDLHEYADRVEAFASTAKDEDCLNLVTRLQTKVPELTQAALVLDKSQN